MELTLSYHELETLISNAANVKLQLSGVDEKTLRVSYSPGWLLPSVSIDIRFAALRRDVIMLNYFCNEAVSLMLTGAVKYLQGSIPKGITVDVERKCIYVNLLYIEQLDPFTRLLTPTSVTLGDDVVKVSFAVNGNEQDPRGNEYCHFTPDKK